MTTENTNVALHASESTKYSISNFDDRKFGLIYPDLGIATVLLYLAIVHNTPMAIKATTSQEKTTRICCGSMYIPSPTAAVIVDPLASSKKNSFNSTNVLRINPTPILKGTAVTWLYQKKSTTRNSATIVVVMPLLSRNLGFSGGVAVLLSRGVILGTICIPIQVRSRIKKNIYAVE